MEEVGGPRRAPDALASVFFDASLPPIRRRVYQDMAPPVRAGRGVGRGTGEEEREQGDCPPPLNPSPPPPHHSTSWFVLKDGKIFWFKSDAVTPASTPRGVVDTHRCLSVKGAEDALGRPHAFELSTADDAMFFIAESDREKEDWINAVGRAIVRHSRSLLEEDRGDYSVGAGRGGGGGGGVGGGGG